LSQTPPGMLDAATGGSPLSERTPPRRGNEIEPLIDGDAMRKALEQAIRGAAAEIDLAYWQLDPVIETLAPFALDASLHADIPGAATSVKRPFGMLLVDALARGVTVRILLSDFEPLFDPELHVDAWSSYYRLAHLVADMARQSPAIDPTLFQMICARHPATLFPGALTPLTGDATSAEALEIALGNDLLDIALEFFNDQITNLGQATALDSFDLAPALWPLVEFDASGAGAFVATATPPFSLLASRRTM
jgi:hypothetical protein